MMILIQYGYCILQGTVVIPCLEFCHKDPQLWERPDQFYPEHFLNADGSFNAHKEGFTPFSVGKCCKQSQQFGERGEGCT